MCLYVPYLLCERLQTDDGTARDARAIAVVANRGGTVRVIRCNPHAAAAGVCHGMTRAEAKALLPELTLEPDDPQADRRALQSLAVWAQAWSPVVQIETPDTLLLDVTGCKRLFHGETNLLHRAVTGLRRQGFSARGAIADTPAAAWAIAHAHPESAVVTTPGRDLEHLLRFPVGALRINERTIAALHAVGVETIEALIYLPRSSLSSRFGDKLLHRLDQALGNVPEPLTPFQPPPAIRAHLRLATPTGHRDVIHRAADHVLTCFCERLAHRGLAVTRWQVMFRHPAASPTTFTLTTSEPTRSFPRLRSLLTTRLERLRLPAKTDGIELTARETERRDARQEELFDTQASDEHELSELVDRVAMRLGPTAVTRVAMVSDHQPEKAYTYMPYHDTLKTARTSGNKTQKTAEPGRPKAEAPNDPRIEHGKPRPLRVWNHPIEVPVVSLAPDGPPTLFRFRSIEHRVVACTGPERLETGWWRGPHVRRDYFRVVTRSGEAFWIYRDRRSDRWFIHGLFD